MMRIRPLLKKLVTGVLVCFLVFFATRSVQATFDKCYASWGSYSYASHRGSINEDYDWIDDEGFCGSSGWPDCSGDYRAEWFLSSCDDPYQTSNFAKWDNIDYDYWGVQHYYIPSLGVTPKAQAAAYETWYDPPGEGYYEYHFTVNQYNYDDEWTMTPGPWYRNIVTNYLQGVDTCPANQKIYYDEMWIRYCESFNESNNTCDDSDWPGYWLSPCTYLGP